MNAFVKFNKGMLGLPIQWQLWVMTLVAANMISPLFFLRHLEAQVVLGTTLASMALMTYLTGRFGFTRIVGLGHILWIPMLAFLFTSLGHIPAGNALGTWIRAVIMLNSVSLLFDAVDVIRYIAGDRTETVVGV